MAAERLIEQSKRGRPECELVHRSPRTFVAFVPGIYQAQDISNALFRACAQGISLRAMIESGDYKNEEDPLRAMVARGGMRSNVLTRTGWLRADRDNMGAFVDYVRDTCALDYLVGVCHMPAVQFRGLELSANEYSDLGITLEDVTRYYGKDAAWYENKRLVGDGGDLQIVAIGPAQDSSESGETDDSEAELDAYIRSLVREKR